MPEAEASSSIAGRIYKLLESGVVQMLFGSAGGLSATSIAAPALILAGDKDRQDPLKQHQREVLPRIPGASIKVIRDRGHLIPIDRPHQPAVAIRAFVFHLTKVGENSSSGW